VIFGGIVVGDDFYCAQRSRRGTDQSNGSIYRCRIAHGSLWCDSRPAGWTSRCFSAPSSPECLLADSEFRHELEADPSPFQGFCCSACSSLRSAWPPPRVAQSMPLRCSRSTSGFLAIKLLAIHASFGRASGHSGPSSWRLGFTLPAEENSRSCYSRAGTERHHRSRPGRSVGPCGNAVDDDRPAALILYDAFHSPVRRRTGSSLTASKRTRIG